jgi:sterol desaturase/sphingolipid hydroxylase (fatty acid hydroxylase superfamily)
MLNFYSIVYWIIYISLVIAGTELFAYLWHRFGAHAEYVPSIQITHNIHHLMDASAQHEANEDFVWLMLLMIIVEIMAGLLARLQILPASLIIITIATGWTVFMWNWWIHRCYHIDDHWLNSYEWFKREKSRHLVHHHLPDKNYGIASHFSDRLFSTWLDNPI